MINHKREKSAFSQDDRRTWAASAFTGTHRKETFVHREKVLRKSERIGVLSALLEMWEQVPDPYNHDQDYILGLRARLHTAEKQLQAMRP